LVRLFLSLLCADVWWLRTKSCTTWHRHFSHARAHTHTHTHTHTNTHTHTHTGWWSSNGRCLHPEAGKMIFLHILQRCHKNISFTFVRTALPSSFQPYKQKTGNSTNICFELVICLAQHARRPSPSLLFCCCAVTGRFTSHWLVCWSVKHAWLPVPITFTSW
jgi:hypothetical protein